MLIAWINSNLIDFKKEVLDEVVFLISFVTAMTCKVYCGFARALVKD